MKYEIVIEKKPLKFIRQQSRSQQIRLYNAIKRLPQAGDVKKISSREGYYRLRVGDYRIIFTGPFAENDCTIFSVSRYFLNSFDVNWEPLSV